jgi:transporter family-2 protein
MVMLTGTLLPLQAGLNASFRPHLGSAVLAAIPNFVVGLIALSLVATVTRAPLPALANLAEAPLSAWSGGLIGASLVLIGVIAAPKLGAALLVACLVTGQLCGSIVVDHFGWAGYPIREVSLGRILGIVLLLAGVVLIQRSR